MARNMKDSGIEWIGEIPEGWEVSQLKYATRWKSEKGCPNAPVLSLYRDFGVVPKDSRDDNHNVTSLDTSNYKVVDVGDLVINKMKAWQGTMAVSDYRGIVSPAYHVCSITSNKVNKRYLHHLLRNPAYLPEYARLSTGMRIGQWDLGFDDFKNIPFLIPPLDEQAKIADYLDNGCASLDATLSKTRSSIEEYKKLKQAVITQAVTKGVRGEREMKDSGVEWIGEIPKKWNRCKLNSICTFINGDRSKNYPSSEDFQDIGIPFIGADSLNGFFVDTYSARHISPAKYASMGGLKITQGDILYTLRGSTIGKNAIANFNDGTIASSLVGIRVKSPFLASSSFLFYWLNSLNEFVQRDLCINGSTAPNLSAENVAQFFIYIPDITEQHEIADYLDAKCAEIDKLIAKKEQLVKELESYKKSLIYEVVTGKREV